MNRSNGPKNRNSGALWESYIEMRCRLEDIDYEKHPLGAKRVFKGRLLPVKTLYDFTLCDYHGNAAFLDAKRTESDNFCYSQLTWHQVQALYERHRRGHKAGYLIFFTKHDQVIWFTADKLYALRPGQSLKASDGILLGSFTHFSLKLIFKGG